MNGDSRTLLVTVRDIRNNGISDAIVRIAPANGQSSKPVSLSNDARAGDYVAESLSVGLHHLHVQAGQLQSEERLVEIGPGRNRERVILGEEGAPFYYRGTVRVPFEPSDLIGVTFDSERAIAGRDEITALADSLGLTERDDARLARNAGSRIFSLPEGIARDDIGNLLIQFESLQSVWSAGLVVAATLEFIVFLSRQIIVRFRSEIGVGDVSAIADSFDLAVVRSIPYVPNGWLLQASVPAGYELLDLCEAIVATGRVVYAEPNATNLLSDTSIHPTDWLAPEQWNLETVKLPAAWHTLRQMNPPGTQPGDPGDGTFGSPDIVIAVMDRGIQSTSATGIATARHPDFQGTVTSGAQKVVQFFDFKKMVPNNDTPVNDHGMACAGVAAALAENISDGVETVIGIAGAAANCRLFGAIWPESGTDVRFADAFEFLAGMDPGWVPDPINYPMIANQAGFPALPSSPADIISNSYVWPTSALAGVMQDALDSLTTYGRNGRGILIFWAAGNDKVECDYGTATYGKVLAVAASTLVEPGAKEAHASYSNWGDDIEFCAPSSTNGAEHNPPTNYKITSASRVERGTMPGYPVTQTALTAFVATGFQVDLPVADLAGLPASGPLFVGKPGAIGAEKVWVTMNPGGTANTIRVARLLHAHHANEPVTFGPPHWDNVFGNTSLSAPLAAGVAALCLSANSELTWIEVRDIMRATAERIDLDNIDAIGKWEDTTGDGQKNFSKWYGWGRIDACRAVIATAESGHQTDIVIRDNLNDSGATPSPDWHAKSPDIWTDPDDVPIPTLPYASAPPHKNPVHGQNNSVFVRVRNVGSKASSEFWVRVLLTHFPGFEFRFPEEWTPSAMPGPPISSALVPGSYLIGEAALTSLDPYTDTIVKFTWDVALVPDDTVNLAGMQVKWHPCLLAHAAPMDGPSAPGMTFDVKDYNNLAQRNLAIADPGETDFAAAVVAGTSAAKGISAIILDRSQLPPDYRAFIRLSDEEQMKRWMDLVEAGSIEACAPLAETEDEYSDSGSIHGRFPKLSIGRVQDQPVIFLDEGGATAIALPMTIEQGQYVPLVLGLSCSRGFSASGELLVSQQRADGIISDGYSVAC